MCPRLDPSLVIARQFDPGGSTKVDEVTQEFLFRAGQENLDIQGLALSLGLDCEGRKEIGSVHRDIDRVMEGGADDLGRGHILVRVQEMNIGQDLARFRMGIQACYRVLARNASYDTALDHGRLSIEALLVHKSKTKEESGMSCDPCEVLYGFCSFIFFSVFSYLDGGIATGSRDVEMLDERMVDVSD